MINNESIKEAVICSETIIIYGAGFEGHQCLRWLGTLGKKPSFFVDTNLCRQDSFLEGVFVTTPQVLKDVKGCLILLAHKKATDEMYNYLVKMGVTQDNTVLNFSKQYNMEGKKLFEKEYSDIVVRNHKKCDKPKVSVIVPIYKVENFLIPCLSSIVDQTMEDLEIILVDEGDHDRCREIIDYYEKIDPRVVAPHEKHGGYGRSCNYGIDNAKGEYLMFIESDDMIKPRMCEEMYDYAKKLDADVVKTPYIEWDGRWGYEDCPYRQVAFEQLPQGKLFSVKEFDLPLSIHASLWSGIYKTSYMRENNIRFVEAKGGAYVDVGFRIDTLVNTEKMAWLDIPYYIYRTTNEDSTTNKFNLTAMLHRWNEVHKKFVKNQEDYDRYYGKALIWDEYLNTLSYIYVLKIDPDDEQKELLIENFSYIKEETIKDCLIFDEDLLNSILDFKKDPKGYFDDRKEEKMELDRLTDRFESMKEKGNYSEKEMYEFITELQHNEYYKRGFVFLEEGIRR